MPAACPSVSWQGGLRAAFFMAPTALALARTTGSPAAHPWAPRGAGARPLASVDTWVTIRPMRDTACHAAPRAAFGGLLAALLLGAPAAWAQDATRPVYRCPGPPVLYTDAITPEEARERNCRTIEGAAVTVVQSPPRPPRPAPGGQGASAPRGAEARPDTRVDPAAQRARDTDARRILQEELSREEQRLAELRVAFNNGEPPRQGDERNFARYQERVAEMRAAIQRKEADIAALRRELAKLGAS
jgi:hypothetical protein